MKSPTNTLRILILLKLNTHQLTIIIIAWISAHQIVRNGREKKDPYLIFLASAILVNVLLALLKIIVVVNVLIFY
jgi:hypothetical protein